MSAFIPTDYSGASPGRGGHHNHTHHGLPTQQATQFIFPVLKAADILVCCSELDIELTKSELTEPQRHKERLRKVFWQGLDLCFGITEEDLMKQRPPPEALSELVVYPELHDPDPMVDLFFFRELAKAMRIMGVHDFSWKDLHHPTPKRFRCQISAFINMAKFREEQLRKYYELMEPRNELVTALQEVHNEHELLVEQLQTTQEESAVKMEEIDAFAQECQDLESEIAKSNKLQAAKREEAAALKREVQDLKDQLSSADWALQETQAEEERLGAQVVSSPNRRAGDLQAKKNRLDKIKEEVQGLEDELEESKAKQTKCRTIIQDLEETIALQDQVLEEKKKHDAALAKLKETEAETAGNEEKVTELTEKCEEAERALHRAEEKLQHSGRQAKMKMNAAHDRLEVAKEQLLFVEKERREGMAKVKQEEADVKDLQACMRAEKEQTELEIATLIADYKETEQAFLNKNQHRMQYIKAAMS